MKPIQDKFSNLRVSRQRKWQMRQKEMGHCVLCGKPAATQSHCIEHAVSQREKARIVKGSKARINSLSYRLQKEAKL